MNDHGWWFDNEATMGTGGGDMNSEEYKGYLTSLRGLGYLSYGQVDDIVDTFDYVNGESEVSKLDFLEYWALTFGFWRGRRA